MAQVSRGERLLERWAKNPKTGLSEPGKDWLIAVLDPFHDTQLKRLEGWPDVETTSSVVRLVKQQVTMSKPTGLAAGNWDCHIALMPWLSSSTFHRTSGRSGNAGNFAPANSYGPFGGLVINPTEKNATPDWFPIVGTGNTQTITLPPVYEEGVGRLVGVGYEITDTTAVIAKQGSITCYRQAQCPRDPSFYTMANAAPAANVYDLAEFTASAVRGPPVSTQQAMRFPGTRVWDMAEGLYQVGTFHSNENTPFSADYNVPIVYQCGDDERTGTAGTSQIYFPSTALVQAQTVGTTVFQRRNFVPHHLHPIHQSGCILAGLGEASTFTVVLHMYYESFPSIEEEAILTLCTPSAEYDATALEIYSHAISLMPVGVKVGENASGDWFYDVVSKIGKYVGKVAAIIPHPIAQAIAPIATGVGRAAKAQIAGPPPPRVKAKKRKVKANNLALAQGTRGPKGKTQGPMMAPKSR